MTASIKNFNPSSANTMEALVKAGNDHKGAIKPDYSAVSQ
jgi:hypothetical protein